MSHKIYYGGYNPGRRYKTPERDDEEGRAESRRNCRLVPDHIPDRFHGRLGFKGPRTKFVEPLPHEMLSKSNIFKERYKAKEQKLKTSADHLNDKEPESSSCSSDSGSKAKLRKVEKNDDDNEEEQLSSPLNWADEVERQRDMETKKSQQSLKARGVVQEQKVYNESNRFEIETDPVVLQRRDKQIGMGKDSNSYCSYLAAIPKRQRNRYDLRTPDRDLKMSRRNFDARVKKWKKSLHNWESCHRDAMKKLAKGNHGKTNEDFNCNNEAVKAKEVTDNSGKSSVGKPSGGRAVKDNKRDGSGSDDDLVFLDDADEKKADCKLLVKKEPEKTSDNTKDVLKTTVRILEPKGESQTRKPDVDASLLLDGDYDSDFELM